MSDKERGLYRKYLVTRTDGNPTGKHERCFYFVLDTTHDKFAAPALRAYGMACRREYPELSKDLLSIAAKLEDALLTAEEQEWKRPMTLGEVVDAEESE